MATYYDLYFNPNVQYMAEALSSAISSQSSTLYNITKKNPDGSTTTTTLYNPSLLSPLVSPAVTVTSPILGTNVSTSLLAPPALSLYPYRYGYNINYGTDLSKDYDVVTKITKYFYFKLLDNWMLKSDFNNILSFFSVNGNEVSLVKSITAKKSEHDEENVNKILNYIENNDIITMNDVKYMLKSFCKKYYVQMVEVYKHEELFRKYAAKQIANMIESDVVSNK